ncbi:10159_t:CDS:1 [Paraglomus occultum]|uniref:10159_t:CDS:1 n=1 Tax=Paraglomus occultum TaxID=144539 RepID=A0A9N8ZZ68_9GLOM|nr:10159_t:CDS:1 [Paraglomus occultum]
MNYDEDSVSLDVNQPIFALTQYTKSNFRDQPNLPLVSAPPSSAQQQAPHSSVPPFPELGLAVGTTFNSWENVDEFLLAYGRQQGFVVRKKRVEKDDAGLVRKRTYDCEHGGRYTPKKKAPLSDQRNRKSKRIECGWHINLSYPKTGHHITVTTFINEHNHDLNCDYSGKEPGRSGRMFRGLNGRRKKGLYAGSLEQIQAEPQRPHDVMMEVESVQAMDDEGDVLPPLDSHLAHTQNLQQQSSQSQKGNQRQQQQQQQQQLRQSQLSEQLQQQSQQQELQQQPQQQPQHQQLSQQSQQRRQQQPQQPQQQQQQQPLQPLQPLQQPQQQLQLQQQQRQQLQQQEQQRNHISHTTTSSSTSTSHFAPAQSQAQTQTQFTFVPGRYRPSSLISHQTNSNSIHSHTKHRSASTASSANNTAIPPQILEEIKFYTIHGNLSPPIQRSLLKCKYPNIPISVRDITAAIQRMRSNGERMGSERWESVSETSNNASDGNDMKRMWLSELSRKALALAIECGDDKYEQLLMDYINEKASPRCEREQ